VKAFVPLSYNGIGASFGYTMLMRKMMTAAVKAGLGLDIDADIALQIMPPFLFQIWRFKTNILFTMFEFDKIPSQWEQFLDKADSIIVPCTDNKKIFSAATKTHIDICPLGVDSKQFTYIEREKKEPFTFLFVGDDSQRKGTRHIAEAWTLWNKRYPELSDKTHLVMKMTSYYKEPKLEQVTENCFLDYRILPNEEVEGCDLPTLTAVYHYAHCLLWPTMGEGWGLPLCEAMSTGLPCIYTPYGGTNDIASEDYAYPVEYEMKEMQIMNPENGDLDPCLAASAIIESIVDRMHEVYTNYDEALEKGLTAATVMRAHFTWEKSADRLLEILERSIA